MAAAHAAAGLTPSDMFYSGTVDAVTAAVGVAEAAPSAGCRTMCRALAESMGTALAGRAWLVEPTEEAGRPSHEDAARFKALWPHIAGALRGSKRYRETPEPKPVGGDADASSVPTTAREAYDVVDVPPPPPSLPTRSTTIDDYVLKVRMSGVKWLVTERPARRPCIRLRGVEHCKLDFRFPKKQKAAAAGWEGSRVKEVCFRVRNGPAAEHPPAHASASASASASATMYNTAVGTAVPLATSLPGGAKLPLTIRVELYELRKVGSGLGTLVAVTSMLADVSDSFVRREAFLQDHTGALVCRVTLDVMVERVGQVFIPPPTPPAPPRQITTQTTPRLAQDDGAPAAAHAGASPPPRVPSLRLGARGASDSALGSSRRRASVATTDGPGDDADASTVACDEADDPDVFYAMLMGDHGGAAGVGAHPPHPIPADPWVKLGDVLAEVNRTLAAAAAGWVDAGAAAAAPPRKNKTPVTAHTTRVAAAAAAAAGPCLQHAAVRVGYALELYLAAASPPPPPAAAMSAAASVLGTPRTPGDAAASVRRASVLSRRMSRGGGGAAAEAAMQELEREAGAVAAQAAAQRARGAELEQWEAALLARERAASRREELLRRRVPSNLSGMVHVEDQTMAFESLSTWDALCRLRGQHLDNPTALAAHIMAEKDMQPPPPPPADPHAPPPPHTHPHHVAAAHAAAVVPEHPPPAPSRAAVDAQAAATAAATPLSLQSEDVRIDTPMSTEEAAAAAAAPAATAHPPPPIPSASPAVCAADATPLGAGVAPPRTGSGRGSAVAIVDGGDTSDVLVGARGRMGSSAGRRKASVVGAAGGARRGSTAASLQRRGSMASPQGVGDVETDAEPMMTDDDEGFTIQTDSGEHDSDAGVTGGNEVVDEIQGDAALPFPAAAPEPRPTTSTSPTKAESVSSSAARVRKSNVMLLSQELLGSQASSATVTPSKALALLHRAAVIEEDELRTSAASVSVSAVGASASTSAAGSPSAPKPAPPKQPELSVSPKIGAGREPGEGAAPEESDEPQMGSAEEVPVATPQPCAKPAAPPQRRVSLKVPGEEVTLRPASGGSGSASGNGLASSIPPPRGGKNVLMLSQELAETNSPNKALALLRRAHAAESGSTAAAPAAAAAAADADVRASTAALAATAATPSPRPPRAGKNVCVLSQELQANPLRTSTASSSSRSPTQALALLQRAHEHEAVGAS